MTVLTAIPAHELNKVGAAAQSVEASGVSTQENRHDAFLPLAIDAFFALARALREWERTSRVIKSALPLQLLPENISLV